MPGRAHVIPTSLAFGSLRARVFSTSLGFASLRAGVAGLRRRLGGRVAVSGRRSSYWLARFVILRVGIQLVQPLLQPTHETGRLIREADAEQAIEREGRVPDPRVAVVPVAFPTDALGQATRRCRHDGSGRLVREQLQHQSGAVDDLAPAARVGAAPQPVAPIQNRVREELETFLALEVEHVAVVSRAAQNE